LIPPIHRRMDLCVRSFRNTACSIDSFSSIMFLLQFLAHQEKSIYSISSIVETSDLGERILEATRSRAESTQWNHHKCRKNATWVDRSMGTSGFCAFCIHKGML
jgi:hypothetical protein